MGTVLEHAVLVAGTYSAMDQIPTLWLQPTATYKENMKRLICVAGRTIWQNKVNKLPCMRMDFLQQFASFLSSRQKTDCRTEALSQLSPPTPIF